MQLRDYQVSAIQGVADQFRSGKKRVLLVSPTGSGKTVMFAHLTKLATVKGSTTYIIVHRAELVQQVSEKLTQFGVPHGFISRGFTPDPTQKVQVAMVQTLVRRIDRFAAPDFIICDEAHHGAAGSWKKVLSAYSSAHVLGVTATPERLDGKGLADMFEALVRGPEVIDLIERGFLAKPRYYAPTAFSDEGIKRLGGDYQKQDLERAVMKSTITGSAVEHYTKICPFKPAVVFCVTVEHSKQVAAQFCSAGYKFEVIDGTLSVLERKELVRKLGSGEIHGLTSCEIISEGFDLPIVTAAILLRPTQSLSLYLQQVGRVLRPSPGKDNAIVLDHVGNLHRHGVAESYRDWSLEGAVWRKKRERANVPTRQCPKCYCVHTVQPQCPECNHVYRVEQRKLKTIDGELVEFVGKCNKPLEIESVKNLIINRTEDELQELRKNHPNRDFDGIIYPSFFWKAMFTKDPGERVDLAEQWAVHEAEFRKSANRREVGAARTFADLIKLGQKRGYSAPAAWAKHVMAARH